MRRHVLLSAALLVGSVALPLSAADWPQWRGPNRDAVSTEAGLLKSWPAEGPKLLWRNDTLAAGYSTPTVAGGKIFVMCNEGMDAEFVRAYSLADGKLAWSSEKVGRVGNPNQRPSYPAARCTPVVEGDSVFAIGSDGEVVSLDIATGKQKWKRSMRADFAGKPGEWAYSESPTIDGNKLIVTPGGPDATVVALDKKTGEVAWRYAAAGGDEAGYSSPVVTEIAGVRQVVQFIGKGLVGLDAGTGALLWSFTETSGRANMTTPVIHDGLIYTGGGLGAGGAAKVVLEGGKWSASKVYVDKRLPQSAGGVVRVGEYLYGSTMTGFACIELKTGTIKWQNKSIGAASVIAADGKLYLHGEDGRVALVDASPDGYKEISQFTPANLPGHGGKDKAYAHPVLADGKLIIRDGPALLCFDVKAP